MTLDPRTSPLAYLNRCAALRHRGLSADLMHDLQAANNEDLLVELEQADDTVLAEMTRFDGQRRAAAAQVFRYFPAEDVCEHPVTEPGRLWAYDSDGRVRGSIDVRVCAGCRQPVGPAVEPLLWDGDQA